MDLKGFEQSEYEIYHIPLNSLFYINVITIRKIDAGTEPGFELKGGQKKIYLKIFRKLVH